MNETGYVFLPIESGVLIHQRSLQEFGGLGGIRSEAGLQSSVFQPQQQFYYAEGGTDPFDLAACYAFHIAQSQAFLDGNKRTGIGMALTFLEMNGVSTTLRNQTDIDALHDAMIAIANRELDKPGLAALFRRLFA